MTATAPRTLLVIPVYNHAATLPGVVRRALGTGLPVLVVDDGSTDGGPEALGDLACQVRRLPRNQGKGAAILAGAEAARAQGFEAIVTVDADGQFDPATTLSLIEEAARSWPQMVIGARRMDQESVPRASLFGRAFSNFWVRLETGRELPDTQSGLRLYPVRELLALTTRARRYDFEIEILVRAAWAGLPIHSVPVAVHYPPGKERVSHFHRLKDNLRLTRLHTRLVLRSLSPWPHRRLVATAPAARNPVAGLSMLHPLRFLKQLCQEHTSALQLGVAVWLGLFLGALPLLACHTAVIIYVTHRLHLNKIAAVTASQLCCPPVVPALCIEIGYFLRHGRLLTEVSWDLLVLEAPQRLWEWLLGSLFVGPLLGLAGGGLTWLAVSRLRTRKGEQVCNELG